ncbi:hypothetical protein EDB87DRAFT_1636869 [Lactarius vividus]|nr:hypothetical protein EDB87DRAFT_1636869 [Lactarius vividus]
MHFYNPSPLSMGYIPRTSYRPALSSSPLAFEGLGHPAFSHSLSPRLDAQTRYRRALHELQAAEEEFEAHLALKHARQAAVLREHAARRERALAIQAELAEDYERHQRALQAQVALDRARRQKHALLHAFVDANSRDPFASERPFTRTRQTHSRPSRLPVFHHGEVPTLEGLLRPYTGTHPHPHDHHLQQFGSPAASQHRSTEPQPSEKQDVETDALKAILEFIHGLAAHAKEAANGSETVPKPNTAPQPQAAPVDEKGKGKAKAEPVAEPTLLQALLGAYAQGPSDQELKDIELAIKLSLEDRNRPDAKKASAAKASRSSPGASSSKVSSYFSSDPWETADVCVSTPSSASGPTSSSKPIPGPPRPVSPLTTIRAVRNQFSNLESTFKFPTVLDFDQSVLSISPINAPVRTYENTLNGLLEQLDAIDSDGDEGKVEKALEDLERRVSEEASRFQVTKDIEMKGYDVQAEEPEAPTAQDAAPADVSLVAKGAEPAVRESSAAIPPADAAVDVAISEEYPPPAPSAVESSKPVVAKFGGDTIAQTPDEDVSSLGADETPLASEEDSSDSVATITAAPTSGPSDVYVLTEPVPETFLASMSHDQFTFPPRPTSSDADASPAGAHEDAVLVDNSEEGESVKSGEDGWSEVDA